MQARNVQQYKFHRGIMHDGVDDADRLISLRLLQNYDIDYTNGAVVKRNGYQRHHTIALGDDPQQIYYFVNTGQNAVTLVIVDGKLYRQDDAEANPEVKNASVSPAASLSFTDGTIYPFITVDDRCFFADNSDFYWCDWTSLANDVCYQVGIDKPDWSLSGQYTADILKFHSYTNPQNTTSRTNEGQLEYKLAQSFTCPTYKVYLSVITLYLAVVGSPSGLVRVRVETDDSGPSGTLVFDDAVSDWFDMSELTSGTNGVLDGTAENFYLLGKGWLDADTTYWIVLEHDVTYTYSADTNYVEWDYQNTNVYANGKAMSYNGTVWSDIGTSDFMFLVGLGAPTALSYYKFALNNNYVGESQPSEEIMITLTAAGGSPYTSRRIEFPSVVDSQVEYLSLYRKKYDTTYSDDYFLVAKVDIDDGHFIDCLDDDSLGGELRSSNSRRPKDKDGNKLVPRYITHWRDRLWLAKLNDNHLYYSMRLDADGSLGYTGEPLYDSYHVENFEPLRIGDTIQNVLPIMGDYLAIYFKNRVWIALGADSTRNPIDDIQFREVEWGDSGLAAPQSLVNIGNNHYFISQEKNAEFRIAEFDGNEITNISYNPMRRLLIQSMLDNWTSIASAQGVANGMEYWIVVTDGGTQTIYIYDTAHENWRTYVMNHTTNHIHIPTHGSLAGTVLLCPNSGTFVMKTVNTVFSDRNDANAEVNVTGLIETQNFRAMTTELPYSPRMPFPLPVTWNSLFVDTYHSGSPTYTVTVTDKDGTTSNPTLSITSDKRTNHTGFRVVSDECRVKIEQASQTADEIRGIIVGWIEQ